MLNQSDLDTFKARVSYKPGATVNFLVQDKMITIVATIKVMNFIDTSELTDIQVTHTFSANVTELLLMYYVQQAFKALELHELDEWLKLDSKCFVEPHERGRILNG